MKALRVEQHGSIDGLKTSDLPRPVPRAGEEILVQVLASGVNRSDLLSAQGNFPHSVLPRTLGRDFAGRVVEGAASGLTGTRVWGSGGDLGIRRDGTHAEFVVLPPAAVAPCPQNLSFEQAATAGVPFVTAWAALMDLGQLKAGDWVIISGAAGAVGTAATRIACQAGARVLALVRSPADRARLDPQKVAAFAETEAGNLLEVARQQTDGKGCALALNGVGSAIFGALLDALADRGRMVVYSAAGGEGVRLSLLALYRRQLSFCGLNTVELDAVACARILRELTPRFESGALEPLTVTERFPLERAAQAYERVAKGAKGKVALVMNA
jgi:NADPH:quinone reductase